MDLLTAVSNRDYCQIREILKNEICIIEACNLAITLNSAKMLKILLKNSKLDRLLIDCNMNLLRIIVSHYDNMQLRRLMMNYIIKGNYKIVRYLSTFVPIYEGKQDGHIYTALMHKHLNIAEMLITRNNQQKYKQSLMSIIEPAALNGYSHIVRKVLLKNRSDPNYNIEKAMNYASYNGNLTLMRFLLSRAQINTAIYSTLCVAAMRGHMNIINSIIRERNLSDYIIPIEFALAHNQEDTAKYIMNNIIFSNSEKHKLIHLIIKYGFLDLLRYFITFWVIDFDGLLEISCLYGKMNMIEFFIDIGCSVNKQCTINVIKSGSIECVEYLSSFIDYNEVLPYVIEYYNPSFVCYHFCKHKEINEKEVILNMIRFLKTKCSLLPLLEKSEKYGFSYIKELIY